MPLPVGGRTLRVSLTIHAGNRWRTGKRLADYLTPRSRLSCICRRQIRPVATLLLKVWKGVEADLESDQIPGDCR